MDRPGSPQRPGTSAGGSRTVRGRNDALVSVANRLRSPMYVSDRALPPEEVTVNNIEMMLRIPSLASGASEEVLVATQCGEDGLVTDPDFLPGVSSLYPDPNQPPASAPSDIMWRRVSGTLYFPSGKGARLLQGVLEDGAFLGALAAVSAVRGGELLLDLIVSDDAAGAGAYTFQFFKHGCWQAVVVDNYLPCLANEERLAFACSAVVGELWPSLMEKAYAKVHGSYYALTGGAVHEALVDLTGGVGFKVKTDSAQGQQAVADGALWEDMQGWVAGKSIIACAARRKARTRRHFDPTADGEEGAGANGDGEVAGEPDGADGEPSDGPGPYGLQYNQVYSVLDVRQVDTRVRLVRLHCPWPGGMWTGPWAQGSAEWESAAVAGQMDYFESTWSDEATFWMPFVDFANFFNRLYVCRMFPPNWHQLTLHCGWQGPSAGGPYWVAPSEPTFPSPPAYQPQPSMQPSMQRNLPYSPSMAHSTSNGPARTATGSGGAEGGAATRGSAGAAAAAAAPAAPGVSSTWCCNPQFRLTVRKACEVLVCLGQQDPTVAHRAHVSKRHRTKAVGLQVLRVPLDSLGRRWEVGSGQLVADLHPSTAREVVASFKAQPEYAYVVVPFAGRAAEEGAFVLRTLSSGPVEVEQLPAPLCLVVGGHWAGFLAGGGRGCPTWGSNPQYMISAPHKAQVVISLTRLDLKYSIIKAAREPGHDLDLVLSAPGKGPDGPGRRAAVRDDELVASAATHGSASNEEAVLQVVLDPDTPYLLTPSIQQHGVEAPYELRLMSAVPLELVPLPEMQTMQLPGEWTAETAGGCNVNPLWKRNPKYAIVLDTFGHVKVTLTRAPSKKPRHPVEDMLGLYVLRASGPDGEIKGDLRKAVVAESTFVPQPETSAEYELNGGCHYVIMPCTYGPGRTGKFWLSVSSATHFTLKSMQLGHTGTHGHHG